MTYQHEQAWLVLLAIGIVSAWIRHFFNLKHVGISRPSILITGAIGMAAIAFWVSGPKAPDSTAVDTPAQITPVELTNQQQAVFDVMQVHCANCHSAKPTDEIFVVAPLGLMFDTWQQVEQRAAVIHQRSVVTKDMPMMNKTNMTEQDRQVIADWFAGK